jgi:peptidyl-prolyl cis-trans isomerase SurA
MKKLLLVLILGMACSVSNVFASEPLDKIVAVVNDDVVTQSEYDSAMRIIKTQMSQQNMPMPGETALQKQVMDQLINKKVQLQVAKAVGINISDADLNNAVGKIAQQNNISDAELYSKIEQEGFSMVAYRGELREQMTIQRLQQQEVINHINVAPDEVNNFLTSKAWVSNSSNEYRLDDILIPVSDSPSTEELNKAKKYADNIIGKLKKGANFGTVAQTESASNAINGGDLGWRSLAEIPSAFGDEVINMKKNSVAGPIQTANGFHVIRLVDVRNTDAKQQAPDRKQVESLLMQRKFEEAVQNWVSKLRGQAYVVVKTEKA